MVHLEYLVDYCYSCIAASDDTWLHMYWDGKDSDDCTGGGDVDGHACIDNHEDYTADADTDNDAHDAADECHCYDAGHILGSQGGGPAILMNGFDDDLTLKRQIETALIWLLTVELPIPSWRYSAHATTFEAAVHGFGSAQELRKVRKEVAAKFPPAKASKH